jgi:oxygen-independent coproporphyrinogen-3 oxidase
VLCHSVIVKCEIEREFEIDFDRHFAAELELLSELETDGLVRTTAGRIEVAALGRIFIRNVAMVFDSYLNNAGSEHPRLFSRTL